ncbi:MAG: hypothetical protein A2Y63_03980 [Candidatus Riflebacteria bacterium RBG_13_59_9]|nr:MAG: hypothetical protein A2Y63_03980 [Candidatus Riflebacteria bacterium RBG_13_59_9]
MKVVFNADDYGSHPQISQGILQAMRHGAVRSTTVLANLVSDEELAWLRQVAEVSVGVHLNLTTGTPLTDFPAACLDPEGRFSRRVLFAPEAMPVLEADVVRGELLAQIERVENAGLAISHLDSHHHVHGFAAVLAVVVQIARQRSLSVRAVSRWMADHLAAQGLCHPDLLVTGFLGKNNIGLERLLSFLREAREEGAQTVEVMCHPGKVDGLPAGHTSYREEREEELRTLCLAELAEGLKHERMTVVSYAQI